MTDSAVDAARARRLDEAAVDVLFREARTRNGWLDTPLDEGDLKAIYDLQKWGATTANTTPARFAFVMSPEAKERLRPLLLGTNVDKTMTAPCCVIVAYDTRFYEFMPQLFPGREMRSMFEGNDALIADVAHRSSTLQGAYLMIAARASGLDCGPMSGFDAAGVDQEFFPDGRWKSNFLCNIGYGSDENLFDRNPRLEFDQACVIL